MTNTGRLETFADGVFAIAITLLVLGIRVPGATEDLAQALGAQWPSFFAYAVSFLTIGIMWVQHHRLFTVIGRSNPSFAMINVVFLMFIAFVPYPTEVLAQHVNTPGWTLATFLYGGTMVAIAILFNAIWAYAASRNGHLLRENVALAAVVWRDHPAGAGAPGREPHRLRGVRPVLGTANQRRPERNRSGRLTV